MRAEDPWAALRRLTPARLALGRAGTALPTAEVLRFALAHAQARDAVHAALDLDRLEREIRALGFDTLHVESAAPDRAAYLARPDWGRRLSGASRDRLPTGAAPDLLLVVGDGLSARAVEAHAAPLLEALRPWLRAARLTTGPVVLARQARVALGDEAGAIMGGRAVAMILGERPGLSAPDSLGVYLTLAPRVGRSDAERNCLSNIRAAGLPYDLAAYKLAWLLDQAFARGLTGVGLKDESDAQIVEGRAPVPAVLPGTPP